MTGVPATQPATASRRAGIRVGGRGALLFPGLAALLVVAVLLNAVNGAVSVGPAQVLGVLLSHAGVESGIEVAPQQDAVVWNIRLPRIVLAALVGGGLALAGAVLQGVFRNP